MRGKDRIGNSSYWAEYLKSKENKQEEYLSPCHACLTSPNIFKSALLRGMSHTDQEETGPKGGRDVRRACGRKHESIGLPQKYLEIKET